jgi:SAM-dependent methyltransferase
MVDDGGASEQQGSTGRARTSSYPPPPPGGSVQVRGTVRVTDRPPPASDGELELELDAEEAAQAPGPEGAEDAAVEARSGVEEGPPTDDGDGEVEIPVEEEADEPPVDVDGDDATDGDGEVEIPVEEEADEPPVDVEDEGEDEGEPGEGAVAVEGAVEQAEPLAEDEPPEDAADPVAEGAEEPPSQVTTDEGGAEGAAAEGSHGGSEPPDEELEIEEVEEEDPEALELQEVESEEERQPQAPQAPPGPPMPPNRKGKRKRPWFEDFFNDDYLRTVPPPTEKEVKRQCDFIEGELGLERGATILDVGCGLGMHAVELAARGYLVVGLDLSLAMLSRAGDEAQDRGLKINFLHGDMRDMAFEGAFDAVLCWGTTFGYFDDETNRQVIARLYKALKPRGLLLLDVVNRDFVISKQPNLIWFEGDGCVCMEETTFNHITSRLEVKRTVILDDGRQRETRYTLRLYSLHELGQILHLQGFRVAEVSGSEATRGVFLGADSPRQIILAERRLRPSAPPTGEHPVPGGDTSIPPPPPTPGNGDD